jgi:mRNA interferase MazF
MPVLSRTWTTSWPRASSPVAVRPSSRHPKAGFPLTLESGAAGLPKRSWIKISQIRTLAVERIGRRLARASEEELEKVIDGLNEIISSP